MAEQNNWIEKLVIYVRTSFTSSEPWLFGVCSGIADKFNLDAGLVRGVVLILALISVKFTVIVYLILWLFFFRGEAD
ncbi:MAG: PspC domain-containing protein [Gammaproteobacteria bacterium]|nr:PspC domain-containing protein [Gammaproteobacteria bacterium]